LGFELLARREKAVFVEEGVDCFRHWRLVILAYKQHGVPELRIRSGDQPDIIMPLQLYRKSRTDHEVDGMAL
jgi:hypothetical protein